MQEHYLRNSTRSCVLLKMFWILPFAKNCRILIGPCDKAFINCQIIFIDGENKTKLVPAY